MTAASIKTFLYVVPLRIEWYLNSTKLSWSISVLIASVYVIVTHILNWTRYKLFSPYAIQSILVEVTLSNGLGQLFGTVVGIILLHEEFYVFYYLLCFDIYFVSFCLQVPCWISFIPVQQDVKKWVFFFNFMISNSNHNKVMVGNLSFDRSVYLQKSWKFQF